MNSSEVSSCQSPRFDSDFEMQLAFAPFSIYLARLLIPLWIIIGIPGGLCSLMVWSSRRMRSSSSMYLCALAVLDCTFLLCQQVPWHLYEAYGNMIFKNPLLCHVFPVFNYSVQYLSPMLTLGFTIERYISICHPFRRDNLCTVKRALIVIACLSLGCFCAGAVQLQFYKIKNNKCEEDERIFDPGTFEAKFYKFWSTSTEVLFFIAVPVIILLFNILVLAQARRISSKQVGGQQQKKGKSTAATVTLLTVSFYQIAAVLPVSIMQFVSLVWADLDLNSLMCGLSIEQAAEIPRIKQFFAFVSLKHIIALLAISHYAMKCFIYLLTGKMFTNQLIAMLSVRFTCLRRWAPQPDVQLPVRRTAEERRRMHATIEEEASALIDRQA